jgi:hypothetical protein
MKNKVDHSWLPRAGRQLLRLFLVIVASTAAWGSLAVDAVKTTAQSSSAMAITTPTFTTTSGNELLLAFIATDGKSAGITVTGVSGASLTWTLVRRTNAQLGTAEIWRAFAPSALSNVTVSASLSQSVAASITVVTFIGADTTGSNGAGAIGNSAGANASSGAPSASLVTTRNGSWVFGVGNDWDHAASRTAGSGQTVLQQYLATIDDTYWVQQQNSSTLLSGTQIFINDTSPTNDRYNLSIAEILPAATSGGTTFNISGTITPSANGLGSTVTLAQGGATIGSSIADANGNYSFAGLSNGAYTVTPAKTGFNFTPASQSVTVNGVSQTANFAAAPQTWAISGTITPAANGAGSQVTLTQGSTMIGTATANGSGSYSFAGLVNGNYTVTPAATGVVFTPASLTVTVSGGNQAVNFTAAPPTWTVSGLITPVTSGASSTLTLTQGPTTVATAIANAGGSYTFSGVLNGAYTVAPAKSGVNFTPPSQSISVSGANVSGVNFSAAAQTWTIQGTISGGSGAAVTLTQGSTTITSATADTNGNYTLSGVGNGMYTVTPGGAGFLFTPASQMVIVSGAQVAGINFTAAQTWAIQGNISTAAAGAGATVTLTQNAATVAATTADSNGNFAFNAISGAYTVTPAKSGYAFTPASQSVTVSGAPVTGLSFTAAALATYTISGNIANGSGASVTLSGSSSASTTADGSGNFSFAGLSNGNYTVAASKPGFSISPASRAATVNNSDLPGINFTAVAGLTMDAVAFRDTTFPSTTATTSAFSTANANELLLAFIASDPTSSGMTVTGVSGGGLTWTLVRRTNSQKGTAEVWRAFATAQLSNATVTATLAQRLISSITVVTFIGSDTSGANGSGAIGATASGSAGSGAPTASLVTTRAGSWVLGVGNDFNNPTARTVGANQTMIHQSLSTSGGAYWVQRQNSTTLLSGTSVTLNDTAPTGDPYNLSIVEVLPPGGVYSISGSLSALGGGGTVALAGAASSMTTSDSSGNYSFSGLNNGSYTVTPGKGGVTFTPPSQTVVLNGISATAVNFTAALQTWSLSGNLSPVSSGSGASLTLGGASSSNATADTSGNYSFAGLTNGTYSVTPSKVGYTFSPTAQAALINNANLAGVNFTVSVVPPPAVSVSISPASTSLLVGGTQQFTATVTGTSNTSVTWSATAGTISSGGRYTAPSTAGTYTVRATSVADPTKSAPATVNVTTAASSTLLLGDQNVESQADASLPLGTAEAFQTTAIAGGSVQSLALYLDPTSTVSQVVAGLYADDGGHPGSLLNQGVGTQIVTGAWNSISLPATSLVAGTPYWIAIMGTNSGTLVFREATAGSCASETSAQNSLTALPSNWATGNASSTCPVSAFGDASKVVFFDNFPGSALSSNWTVIARHGEYSQNESECNIAKQVAVANNLAITTAAQSFTCGDFHPDGTVWHAPAAWPYSTGDIQWTSLNFTYGTVEIRAQFPPRATSLWPATWLLGSNCQSTNPLTGETGIGGCPNLGGSGYQEIDMTECYGSTWCQFHVADPGFGIGNGCDATYSNVDTNFHTFKTVWNSSGVTQYLDGVAFSTCQQKMSNPMFLIIQTQTGGVGGTPNNAALPAGLVVNYVKVTQP